MEAGNTVKQVRGSGRAKRAAALSALVLALSHCSSDSSGSLGSAGQNANAGQGAGGTALGGANSGGAPSASGGASGHGGSASGMPGSAGSNNSNSGASSGGASSGGASSGGASSGGASGGGASGGGASGGGASGGGASGGGAPSGGASGMLGAGGQAGATAFACNLVLGVSPTGQWFDSGFLSLVAADRWEAIWVAHHYTSFWADPADSAWSQAFDPYPGPAHQCTQGAKTPERVLFVAVNWTYTNESQWRADLNQIVQNLQARYPTLRRIELMTLTRAPGNVVCASGGSSSETIIPAWTDAAIAATAAKYPALVVAAPKFEVPHCADFMGGGTAPQYTDAGAADVAQLIGSYYAAHP